jgi:hypothetical protein
MMTGFCLLHKGIEGSTTVRPLFSVFWTGCDEQLEAIRMSYEDANRRMSLSISPVHIANYFHARDNLPQD